MITVDYGDTVIAELSFDYSGPPGHFTFALEIGTILAPGFFNTLDRWETRDVYISPGAGQKKTLSFTVQPVDGLNRGDIYDMNWEIGTGSQDTGDWKLITRLFTDDVIQIAEAEAVFSNLKVSYVKA